MSVPEAASPLPHLLPPGRHGATHGDPVRIAAVPAALVHLAARKDRATDLAGALHANLGLTLPPAGKSAGNGRITALRVQPDAWLLRAPPGAEGALATEVKAACGTTGSAVDQTHGRAIVRIAGSRAAWVLAKLCRIDLHPSVLAPGDCATTQVGHLTAVIHHTDPEPAYDLVFMATFAGSFVETLLQAAEETGYVIF